MTAAIHFRWEPFEVIKMQQGGDEGWRYAAALPPPLLLLLDASWAPTISTQVRVQTVAVVSGSSGQNHCRGHLRAAARLPLCTGTLLGLVFAARWLTGCSSTFSIDALHKQGGNELHPHLCLWHDRYAVLFLRVVFFNNATDPASHWQTRTGVVTFPEVFHFPHQACSATPMTKLSCQSCSVALYYMWAFTHWMKHQDKLDKL